MKTHDSLGRRKCVSWWRPLVHPFSYQPASPPSFAGPAGGKSLGVPHKKWLCNFTHLHGYSHNAQGLKDDLKIERLAHALTLRNISFCCLQETWLSGDDLHQVETSKDANKNNASFFIMVNLNKLAAAPEELEFS
eukprot:15359108-Ditylum_brightwellii.AAC.1